MDILITPSALTGKVTAPPSKSAAHRAAICAALASGTSRMSPVQPTKDMLATIESAKALGASAALDGETLTVTGISGIPEAALLDCGESGSTLRFFVPVAASLGVNASFRGHGRLPMRPMDELIQALTAHGITIKRSENEIMGCSGKLLPGLYEIGGSTSSQYITGLLFALPLLGGDSEIRLTSPLQSRGYVDMTIAMQKRFGVYVEEIPHGWKITGNQRYLPQDCDIEGDYSNAAFWLCAAGLSGKIEVDGLDPASKQGDRQILEILSGLGADVKSNNHGVQVSCSSRGGFEADLSQIPDLMPILAVTAAFSSGTSRLYNAGRLRIKESDRLYTVSKGLRKLGAEVTEHADELVITGCDRLRGGATIDSFGDHRIAMSMSIAAAYCLEPSVITGAECVDKSYPDFYNDFKLLGGIFNVL